MKEVIFKNVHWFNRIRDKVQCRFVSTPSGSIKDVKFLVLSYL